MKKVRLSLIVSTIFVLVILACNSLVATPAATNPPPVTPPTSVPSEAPAATSAPTNTAEPLPTPDTAATQQADELNSLLQTFNDKGYLDTMDGNLTPLTDFKEQWAQIGWFKYWPYDVTATSEFVFKSHFSWQSASSTPEASGCGVLFGLQDNGDYYATFLDKSRIYFYMKRGANLYTVGKTSGPGKTSFANPAESDFAIAVNNQKAYVSVDGTVTVYTLSVDQTAAGQLGMSILSGTNRDFGTKCEATNTVVWDATK